MTDKDTFFSKKRTINCRGQIISLEKPLVMAILNTTPDSFYDGGKYSTKDELKIHIEKIISQGADIIDVGGYSSRPGAKNISEKEELERIIPALETIREISDTIPISVDTFRANIAKTVVCDYNVDIINDISAGNLDPGMFSTIAELKVPYVLMHMQGNPQNMQNNPNYDNLIKDVFLFFANKIDTLKKMGVADIIIDPGFGFGKTIDDNYMLLNNLNNFDIFELPILAGISRKSMIYKFLDTNVDLSLNGTTVLNTIALQKGADILRVHDVAEAKETIKLAEKLKHINNIVP